jgi:D-glycero-alpha-D-manno-heptose-7-phosphate kinase
MIITQTPLRVSFAGGLTDFVDFYTREPGKVVSTAIDKYIFVIINERFDNKIYINYSKKEIVDHVDDIEHDLVREALRVTGVSEGIEITTLADIPSEGSGLGSSSSVTVGLLNALYTYRGDPKTPEQLAADACHIEIDRCGKPIGKQDQYITAYGGLRCFTFHPDRVDEEKVPLSLDKKRMLSDNLMLFYTNRTRKADDILLEQKNQMDAKFDYLKHIKSIAVETRDILTNGRIDGIGELLHRGWSWKSKMSGRVSNTEIDIMYNAAREAGALGGKICGAGAGGFLLLYCPHPLQTQVREALAAYRELPFNLERDGSKVIFNMRRYEWK